MRTRWLLFAFCAAASGLLTLSSVAGAKDLSPEQMAEQREKVRADYEGEKKGGYTFYDLKYWVDAAKLEDKRWSKEKRDGLKHTDGLQLLAKWTVNSSAAGNNSITVVVQKWIHFTRNGNSQSNTVITFDNYGDSVSPTDVEKLCEAYYENFRRGSKDVIDDQCQKPKKCSLPVPKVEAAAVATDKDSGERERREWYIWSDNKETATYVVSITYSASLLDKPDVIEKGRDFVKSIRELKDKRVVWE
mgnify:CR=1 FL=1